MTLSDDEFRVRASVKYPIEAIDKFIAGGGGVPISNDVAEHLREIRQDAFQACQAKDWQLMNAHLRALHYACYFYGARPSANKGEKNRRVQAMRRFDKPAVDSDLDASRNDRIRKFHARLESVGEIGATAQTAAEFSLSTRRIRAIVSSSRKQPG